MDKKKVNNAAYRTTIDIGAGKGKQLAWYLVNVLFLQNPFNIFSSLKVFLLRSFGARVGTGVVIKPSVNIKYPWKLVIGDHAWIGEEAWIDNLSEVRIGAHVTISQGALLLTGSHDHSRTTFDFMSEPIVLEDGCWIGARATVLGGVRCGTHAILGVSAVASQDLKPYVIYQGNPASPVMVRTIS